MEFEQQYYSPSDLTMFFVEMGLDTSTPVTVIGPNNITDPGVEANLDIQWYLFRYFDIKLTETDSLSVFL